MQIARIDFTDSGTIGEVIQRHDIVYNCTAAAGLQTPIQLDAEVEIQLTRKLIEAAAVHRVSRFIQLSTIVIYDFLHNEPIDETYLSQPEYPIQQIGMARERIVEEVGRQTGLTTIILRPASTIGARDSKSFFARLFAAHASDRYPMIGEGTTQVSLVDTRDIGKAMVWLATCEVPEGGNERFLLKGFDTTWRDLKLTIDQVAGKVAGTISIPETLTKEQMSLYQINPFMFQTFTVNRLWNDSKIRNTGFRTRYTLQEAVESAVHDLHLSNQM